MVKTGPEIRHDAKQRMIKYRAEMTAKGYISTTVFLSEGHRAELKRLGNEHRLTRAEAAEHIFKIYLESENKNITQAHNTNTDKQTETLAIIEALEARIEALEKQAGKTEYQTPGINQSDDMPETEDNDGIILELAIEQDDSEDINSQTDESETVIEQPLDIPGAIVYDGLVLEPDDFEELNQSEDQDPAIESESAVDTDPEVDAPTLAEVAEKSAKRISETQGQMFDDRPDQEIKLPDYLIDVDPDMPVEERHKIILRLAEDFPGRKNAQMRINLLNAAGITLKDDKPWETPKQFTDQLSIARKWAKKS